MKLTLSEVKPIIKYIIENNQDLQSRGQKPISVNLRGHAGLGKSLICKELADELGANFVKINTSNLAEPSDLVGFPQREYYVCRHDSEHPENDECAWITTELLEAYAKTGWSITDETRMGYAIPYWLKQFKEGDLNILLIDDWTRKII